jgi:hypothetical protein
MKLTGPDFFEWMGLRRVRRGGLARYEDHYYDQGIPVPGCLIPLLVERLLKDRLCELADPDEYGMRRVSLTDTGQAQYRLLCKLQRRRNPASPPADQDRTTRTTPER